MNPAKHPFTAAQPPGVPQRLRAAPNHRIWHRWSPRTALVSALLVLAALLTSGSWYAGATLGPSFAHQPSHDGPQISVDGWWSWALLDRRDGAVTGGLTLKETNTAESMIKIWIAADYLREVGDRKLTGREHKALRRMIRLSDDDAAQWLYEQRGEDAVVRRMINDCGLADTRVHHRWWSLTKISARDAVQMADCIVSGEIAGPRWTRWILGEMHKVSGEGNFGIQQAWPAGDGVRIAIKNGWTAHSSTGMWHINCLGLWDHWVLAVQARYPAHHGLAYGDQICRQATRQIFG